jgi:tetratricopeptide (TPR) repeat protein
MRMLSRVFAVTLTLSLVGGAQSFDIQQSGEYVSKANDSREVARQLAMLEADFKALSAVGGSVAALPAIKALGLTPQEVAAYLAGILDLPDPRNSIAGLVHTSEISFSIDIAAAVQELTVVQRDFEVALDLMEAAKRSSQLRNTLTTDNRAVAGATGAAVASAVQARQKTLLGLQTMQLLARARAALARQEIGSTSVPIIPDDGLARAKQLVDEAMKLDPSTTYAHRVLGDILLAEGDDIGAEREFRLVLKQMPNSAMDHNKLGNALSSQGKDAEAIAEFRQAIRLDPSDFVSHSDLGVVLRAQDDSEALKEFREAIRIEPRYIDAHNNLGIALAQQGKTTEALAEFQQIIRLRPDSALGYFNAATALADLEKDEESTDALRQAVRLNPNHYNAHYNLGEMLRLAGNLEESAKEFREYVNRAPDNPRTERNKERAKTFIKAFEEP